MASIVKGRNPGKQWTVRYRDASGKQREKSFRTRREASDFMTATEHSLRSGTYADPKLGDVRFGEVAREWTATRTAPRTRVIYTSILGKHLKPIAGTPLRKLAQDRSGVQSLILSLPASQQQSALTLLTGTLNAAVRDGRISQHRLTGLAHAKPGKRANILHATSGQLHAMADALDHHGLTVWLMRGCGLRLGEALAIEPNDIMGDILRVSRQVNDAGHSMPLKHRDTDSFRDVPLPAYVADMLEGFTGFPAIHRTTYGRHWRTAGRQLGLPRTFTPHVLRHIFASTCLSQGVPLTEVSAWLGHASVQTTYSLYAHVIPSSFDRARQLLDAEYRAWNDGG